MSMKTLELNSSQRALSKLLQTPNFDVAPNQPKMGMRHHFRFAFVCPIFPFNLYLICTFIYTHTYIPNPSCYTTDQIQIQTLSCYSNLSYSNAAMEPVKGALLVFPRDVSMEGLLAGQSLHLNERIP